MSPRVGPRLRVIVVGVGLGGLSAACHLAGRGHDVMVLERGSRPGGRAGRVERDGYAFDTGPTVLTMPGLLEDTLAATGAQMSDHLDLQRLDPAYRANFADGSTIHLRHGRDAMVEEIRQQCGPVEAAAFERFSDWLTDLYRLEMQPFIARNYDHPWDLLVPLMPALRLLGSGALGSLSRKVASYFRDERLQRLFSFQAMYAGVAPHQARALFAVITYMDSIAGVFYPAGGIASVADALAAAAVEAGTSFRYNVEVERVLLAAGVRGRVRGVRLSDGEVIPGDAVVVNADLPVAYRDLLPDLEPPRVLRRAAFSPSALVWHVGVRGTPPPEVAHHNIHFGREWRGAFRALLEDGRRMPDPSVLVTVPTVTDPSLAPPGSSVLYVLEPAPNLGGRVDWSRERSDARDRLAALVSRWGYPLDIETELFVDPLDWSASGMAFGTPFALAHTFFQSGPFRPANVDRRVPGLVFVGSGTVPGVGVPMVLVSGRLAADRVEEMT